MLAGRLIQSGNHRASGGITRGAAALSPLAVELVQESHLWEVVGMPMPEHRAVGRVSPKTSPPLYEGNGNTE